MVKQICFSVFSQFTILSFLLIAIKVTSDDVTPIPEAKDQIESWFSANVKPLAARTGTLDSALAAAEAKPKTITVKATGGGTFKTIADAIESVPANNKERVIIDIGPGIYTEKLKIPRDKPFITFLGPPEMATIQFGGTAKEFGTVYSATLEAEAEYFVMANIIMKNTAPAPDGVTEGAQAVALRTGASRQAFYNVRMHGFQDTLCDDKGYHFFKDCYIEGTVDFIFGSGKSIYLNTEINVLQSKTGPSVITAQARDKASEDTGYSFVHCDVKGAAKEGLLGRAWKPMPRVAFSYTSMSAVISPEGWSNNGHPERDSTIFFGEFKCTGAGANPAGRVKFSKQLTMPEATPFLCLRFIEGSSWLLPPPKV